MIVTQVQTEGQGEDATTVITLIEAVDGDMASVTADPTYDTIAIYKAAEARGATVVIPPTKTATVSRRRLRSSASRRAPGKLPRAVWPRHEYETVVAEQLGHDLPDHGRLLTKQRAPVLHARGQVIIRKA